MITENQRILIHESSHTCMFILLKRPFHHVSIVPNEGHDGYVYSIQRPEDESNFFDNGLIAISGMVGENIFFKDERYFYEGSADYKVWAEMASRIYGPENFEVGRWSIKIIAKQMLRENMDKIQRIATALEQKKLLYYDEVLNIFNN